MTHMKFRSGENTCICPRNRVGVRTTATTTVAVETRGCTIPLDKLQHDEIWIPRAQGFLFLLNIIFDERIKAPYPLTLIVPEVVSHSVERAEVSKHMC